MRGPNQGEDRLAAPTPRGGGRRPVRRREVLAGAAALLAALPLLGPDRAMAQAYPTRPIMVIVPFPPGGNADVTARLVTEAMGRELGQPFVVNNRGGGAGIAGTEAAGRAAKDGYTLLATAMGSFIVTPKLIPKKVYATTDFAPVGLITTTPIALLVNAKSRFNTIADLIAFAKENPGKVSIGHSGNGTTNHLAALTLQKQFGITLNIIPYRGSGPALIDILGGQIDAIVDQVSSSIDYVRAKTLRPLAVTTRTRAKDLPDTPTMIEAGAKAFDIETTSGLLAPAGTPPAIIEKLNAALNTALGKPDLVARFQALGAVPSPSTPAAFAALIKEQGAMADALIADGLLKSD